MKDAVIQKIELKIGGKTIALNLEQLRELKDALRQLFPEPAPAYPIVIRERYPLPYIEPYRWTGPLWASNHTKNSDTLCLSTN